MQIVVLVVLIGLSGFFSSSETALTSVNKIKIRHMVEGNVKGAKLVEKLIDSPKELLGAILIGNNIVNIGASSLATVLATTLFENTSFKDTGVAIAIGVMTILILIFGEITPKSLAQQNAETVSIKVSKPIAVIVFVLKPFVWVFTKISSLFIRILGGDPDKAQPFITEEELKTLVDVGNEEGVLEEDEKEMIFNVFEFGDSQVKDIMVQRVDIIAEDTKVSYVELLEGIKEYQFSRIPIYDENIDDIVGIFNTKDLILLSDEEKQNFDIKTHMRKPHYTFEFKKITDLFNEMKKTRNHISVVLDEYGGTVGIVTIEDLIEEIVGEIEDEYDEHQEEIVEVKENEYIVDGSTRLEDLSEIVDVSIESDEFDSVGGFVIGTLDRLPETGEHIEFENLKFVVEEIDKKRIKKVRVFVGKVIPKEQED
ncbi:HlyC/CorC family transporter [uncultured Clostridium sp.]|jgi:CBS domain containing-hemolysin-like protein|uniref:HlyC/CorC family transporter n=1 Tax=uncultured Clostridium sp. TaxID=59620 RepID=UPI0026344D9F|nr:hemolysin family protein [uncultured Clostridium sp.]